MLELGRVSQGKEASVVPEDVKVAQQAEQIFLLTGSREGSGDDLSGPAGALRAAMPPRRERVPLFIGKNEKGESPEAFLGET